MAKPLIVPESRLDRHLTSVQAILDQLVSGTQIILGKGIDPLVVGLVGDNCEMTSRNRGPKAFLAPLREIRHGLVAWLGYREEWLEHASSRSARRRFSFRSSAVTIHIGARHSQDKPQLFRAEWQGLTPAAEHSHDATKGPGHPHWQVDALESFGDYESQAQELWLLLKEEVEESAPKDFSPEAFLPTEHEEMMAVRNNLSRLHFASAAAWWRNVPENEHSHIPTSPNDIESWLRGTLNYTLGELHRL